MTHRHLYMLCVALTLAIGLWPREDPAELPVPATPVVSGTSPSVPCEIDCKHYLTICNDGNPIGEKWQPQIDACAAACRVAKPRDFYACFHRDGGWCSALLPCWEAAQ